MLQGFSLLRKIALLVWALFFSTFVSSHDGSTSVFYPLPSQAQGTYLSTQHLYLDDQGGLWIHDVHGNVSFYDGNSLHPERGSLLGAAYHELAYLDGTFWTFFHNEVYLTTPGQDKQLVFSVSPGVEIKKIGASEQYVWVSDGKDFYTFDTRKSELETYSLFSLYRQNNSSDVRINDAEKVLSKWVLGTNSGVYASKGREFEHIKATPKNHIDSLYFSKARRELLVGTKEGALVVNIEHPSEPIKLIGTSHVQTVAETHKEYWVGTEHGLYIYSFLDGRVEQIHAAKNSRIDLSNSKINALVNDKTGGMWVATESGVYYYSLFSRKFQRLSHSHQASTKLIENVQFDHNGKLWLLDKNYIYSQSHDDPDHLQVHQRVPAVVNDSAYSEGVLWLATNNGLYTFRPDTGEVVRHSISQKLNNIRIDHISIAQDGSIWVISGKKLYCINDEEVKYKNLGDDWVVEKYLPAKVTALHAISSDNVIIGTDHGVYRYNGFKIEFDFATEAYGTNIDIAVVGDAVWFASRYGLFKTSLSGHGLTQLPLVEQNIRLRCLVETEGGVWLANSTGLSFYNQLGELISHFGEPLGLINNEFINGACTGSSQHNGQLLTFASKYGPIVTKSKDLLTSKLPAVRAILSRATLNGNQIRLATKWRHLQDLPYSSSLVFTFGAIPFTSDEPLFYRLDDSTQWQMLDGRQLTFEHLAAGDYNLQVKAGEASAKHVLRLSFNVKEVWYRDSEIIIALLSLGIGVVILLVYWRSRYVVQLNKELSGQVELKTNQLRHQSRVLLTSNQQLRKQLQVRNILVGDSVNRMREGVDGFVSHYSAERSVDLNQNKDLQNHITSVYRILEDLASEQLSPNTSSKSYNLSQVIRSVVNAWSEDINKSGVRVSFHANDDTVRVLVEHFNLDVIFNGLIASCLKRSYRGQEIELHVTADENRVTATCIDFGESFYSEEAEVVVEGTKKEELGTQALPSLVNASGGTFAIDCSAARNKLEMSWPKAAIQPYRLPTPILGGTHSSEPEQDTSEAQWLAKVENLVEVHCADPEFGTAAAAKMLFTSERSLQRRFKAHYKRTFKDYLNEHRLEKACEHLLSGAKVSEAAFDSGFNDPSYFSQRFKHHFGMTPSQFIDNGQ